MVFTSVEELDIWVWRYGGTCLLCVGGGLCDLQFKKKLVLSEIAVPESIHVHVHV